MADTKNVIHDEFLFYGTCSDTACILDSVETEHAVKVLRCTIGDTLFVTDGAGSILTCLLSRIKGGECLCEIRSRKYVPPQRPDLIFFVGITEKNPFEKICQMLPPMNVSRIVPFYGENTTKNWWRKGWKKAAVRFERILKSSIKQSHTPYITKLDSPLSFQGIFESGLCSTPSFFADPRGDKISGLTSDRTEDVCYSCFVGPPEGFSENERNILLKKNAQGLFLSPHRLRTEVAAVSFAAVCNQL
ncbi:MAG: RsmE family RNA methyltransferase [Fibrobacterota bacterium]